MGLADVILGEKINRTSYILVLSDTHYTDKFNKFDSNIARTYVDVNLHLSKNGKKGVS